MSSNIVSKLRFLATCMVVAVLGIGVGTVASAGFDNEEINNNDQRHLDEMSSAERDEALKLEHLPSGESMGIVPDAQYNESDLPDYILVVATNGNQGYVRKEDFTEPTPQSPAEAAAMMERELREGPSTIPVFAADGSTIIGRFEVGGGILEMVHPDGAITRYDFDNGIIEEETPDGSITRDFAH